MAEEPENRIAWTWYQLWNYATPRVREQMKIWYWRRRDRYFLDYWEKAWIIRTTDEEKRQEEALSGAMGERATYIENELNAAREILAQEWDEEQLWDEDSSEDLFEPIVKKRK